MWNYLTGHSSRNVTMEWRVQNEEHNLTWHSSFHNESNELTYALETVTILIIKVPSKSVENTSYEMWFGNVPNLTFLKISGRDSYVTRLMSDKLEPKLDKYFFVSYPKETRRYYFYYPSENKTIVARHVIFLEKEFLLRESSRSVVSIEEV
jgi:hypothetical protein